MSLYVAVPSWIRGIPDHLRTQEMCNEALHIDSYSLLYVPDQYETQQMSNELMHTRPTFFHLVSVHFKTQEMCIKAVEVDPWQLYNVPDHFKSQKMCDAAVSKDPYALQYVPDWFVVQEQVKIWHDDDDYCNDNEIVGWYDKNKKRKTQKAKIKEELLPTAWHPTRMRDCCMLEDDKKETEKLWKDK